MTKLLKFVLSAVMLLTSGLPVAVNATDAPACGKALFKKCEDLGTKIAAERQASHQTVVTENKTNMNGAASGASQTDLTAATAMDGAAAECSKMADQCTKACSSSKNKQDSATCKKALAEKAAANTAEAIGLRGDGAASQATAVAARADGPPAADTPSGNTPPASSSGGMGALGGAALGALGGGLLGYMLGKKSGEKDKELPLPLPLPEKEKADTALQDNGTLDCSKSDSHKYSDCNSYFATVCKEKMKTGAFTSDKPCEKFSKRYCGVASKASKKSSDKNDDMPVKDVKGEGLTDDPTFCQSVLAENYCKPPSGKKPAGRDDCPSCLQIATNRAPACVNNPALCMAQNSAEQINLAKTSCPTDPVFANPANIKTGSQIVTELNPGVTLPVVTLPTGTPPAAVAAGAGAPVLPVSAGGASVVSTMSAQSVQSAVRDGQGSGINSQAASGSAGGYSREIASGSPGGVRPSSAAIAGPASDVQGQFGPSVFALGSQVIRQRCQAGKLNCR